MEQRRVDASTSLDSCDPGEIARGEKVHEKGSSSKGGSSASFRGYSREQKTKGSGLSDHQS